MSTATSVIGKIDCGGYTLPAQQGAENHDRFLIGHLSKSMVIAESNTYFGNESRLFGAAQAHVLLVADGFSDAECDTMAETAAETISRFLVVRMPWSGSESGRDDRIRTALETAFMACHESILETTPEDPNGGDVRAGTTLTLAFIVWPSLYLFHAGNSRGYLIRDHRLRRLTADHVRPLHPQVPDVTEMDIASDGATTMLTNALGDGIRQPRVDSTVERLQVGDQVLLCTAGLTHGLHETRIESELRSTPTAAVAAEGLVEAARQQGANQDITAVVANFTGADQGSEPS